MSADGERWVLLNASPDLRQQLFDNPPLHPCAGLRHSPLRAVVLTNADVDHVAGLLTLRESQPFALYATRRVHDLLSDNPVFGVLRSDLVPRRDLEPDREVTLADVAGRAIGLSIQSFPVRGKVALYREDPDAGPDLGTVPGDTIGLRLRDEASGRCAYYVPGCAGIDGALAERLRAAALLLFDGTLWDDGEMIEAGIGAKTGGRMGHISMTGRDGSITALRDLEIDRKVFIHINNTNPALLADSQERASIEAAGWEVAHDGQEFEL